MNFFLILLEDISFQQSYSPIWVKIKFMYVLCMSCYHRYKVSGNGVIALLTNTHENQMWCMLGMDCYMTGYCPWKHHLLSVKTTKIKVIRHNTSLHASIWLGHANVSTCPQYTSNLFLDLASGDREDWEISFLPCSFKPFFLLFIHVSVPLDPISYSLLFITQPCNTNTTLYNSWKSMAFAKYKEIM